MANYLFGDQSTDEYRPTATIRLPVSSAPAFQYFEEFIHCMTTYVPRCGLR